MTTGREGSGPGTLVGSVGEWGLYASEDRLNRWRLYRGGNACVGTWPGSTITRDQLQEWLVDLTESAEVAATLTGRAFARLPSYFT